METRSALRPRERRMLRLAEEGVDELDIAWRFRRTPRYVRQVLTVARAPGRSGVTPTTAGTLRPIERRVMRWREEGAALDELAPRFRRTSEFLEQVERLARYKLETA
ncbi:MAG: hypothetical protein M5U14_08140 [Acidimicrobiia bacterium]|nr:hypothetical protein [Acidimicrobiia bacterium]